MNNHKPGYYIINGITMYRLISAPLLLVLALSGQLQLFKWLLLLSFATDAIDGPLSRKYHTVSVFGARLDSVADDATVFAAILVLAFLRPEFLAAEWVLVLVLLSLFLVQMIAALAAYRKVTSFHTYMAKLAAVAQALFFLSFFFETGFEYTAFYIACLITALELLEEIILVIVLPEWRTDVKGLFWVWNAKKDADKLMMFL